MTLEDMSNELSSYSYLKTVFPQEGLTDEDFEWTESYFEAACSYLETAGLLTSLYLAGQTFYYYPMIGSKPPMKKLKKIKRPGSSNTENMTAVQKSNEEIKDVIYSFLAQLDEGEMATIVEIQESCPELENMSNQRISAIVRQMIGVELERIEDKRKAYFRVKK